MLAYIIKRLLLVQRPFCHNAGKFYCDSIRSRGSVEQTIAQIQGIGVDAGTHNGRREFGLAGVKPRPKASLSKGIWTRSISARLDPGNQRNRKRFRFR